MVAGVSKKRLSAYRGYVATGVPGASGGCFLAINSDKNEQGTKPCTPLSSVSTFVLVDVSIRLVIAVLSSKSTFEKL
jgi:hypothetical protein